MSADPTTSPSSSRNGNGRPEQPPGSPDGEPVAGERRAPRTSRERLRRVLDSIAEGFMVLDEEWHVAYVNAAGAELLARPRDGLLGEVVWDLFPEGSGSTFEDHYRRAVEENRSVRFEAFHPPLDLWMKVHAYPYEGGLAVVFQDVTDYRRTVERYRESEARHRAILQAIPDRILWFSASGVVVDAEPSEHETAAQGRARLVGRCVRQLYPEAVALRFQLALQRAIRTQRLQRLQYTLPAGFGPRPKGAPRTYEARLVPIERDGVLAILRDVTRQRQLEQEVLRISDEERQRIGRDLHDGLSSHLTGVALQVRRLARDARRGQSVPAEALGEVATFIAEGAEDARRLAHGLNPARLQQEGLAGALRELCETTTTLSELACAYEGPDDEADVLSIPIDVATHLYRIAQEAVHHALRHARASRLRVRVAIAEDHLVLRIRDDGVGVETEGGSSGGMGLRVMRYRAHLIGATLDVEPHPQGGTAVTCMLPLGAARTAPPGAP
ncbi:MAG: PAS domain-containing protein [Rhodothermales bacterium]|nr:PAS domain-containing protein [Rhodothermales bacterium]